MIVLDTNILARHLLEDDPPQFRLAKGLLSCAEIAPLNPPRAGGTACLPVIRLPTVRATR
jgi:hypothetical protein